MISKEIEDNAALYNAHIEVVSRFQGQFNMIVDFKKIMDEMLTKMQNMSNYTILGEEALSLHSNIAETLNQTLAVLAVVKLPQNNDLVSDQGDLT